jgi:hypothetical protein
VIKDLEGGGGDLMDIKSRLLAETEKESVRTVGTPTGIRTGYLPYD